MPWSDLPPLNALLPFEATVRLGSASSAALELKVTHGAVSRQLRILESAVGNELFDRRGRGLEPTPAAVELSKQVASALDLLSSAVRQAQPRAERSTVVVSCEPTLLMRWLLPRLPTLTAQIPEMNVHLSAAGGPIDLRREAVDVAVRRNDHAIPNSLQVTKLFEEWIGPVCSPEVAAHAQTRGYRVIPRLTAGTRPEAWDTWQQVSAEQLDDAPHRVFEHFYLSLEAATAQLGVAIGPYALVKNDLETGRLVAPRGFLRDGSSYVVLTSTRGVDDRVIEVVKWLRRQAADSIPPGHLRGLPGEPGATKPTARS